MKGFLLTWLISVAVWFGVEGIAYLVGLDSTKGMIMILLVWLVSKEVEKHLS